MLTIYKALSKDDRKSLLDFAEFLMSREVVEEADKVVPQPNHEPRPDKESVVQAIKRLGRVYHMIDRATLLNETSTLMTQHVMQGRAAIQVIDDLESLFANRYRTLLGQTSTDKDGKD